MVHKEGLCLITRLRCDELYDIEVEPSNIRFLIEYFPHKFGFAGESIRGKGRKGKGKANPVPRNGSKKVSVTCAEREMTLCKNKNDPFKLGYYTSSRVS